MAALRRYYEFICLQGKDVCATAANMYELSASVWKDVIDLQLNAAAEKNMCVCGIGKSTHYVLSLSMHPVAFKYPSGTARMTNYRW